MKLFFIRQGLFSKKNRINTFPEKKFHLFFHICGFDDSLPVNLTKNFPQNAANLL